MTTAPADPRMALDAASSQELVQRKLSVDAMRKRVSGGPDKDAKLRDACEGFEAMFIQKMWEQMRKNIQKEGYLHSKDEEAYQSMFDVELAKKMASAGGIGLGEMLYEQLNQRLTHTSKTTGAGSPGMVLPISPALEVKTAAISSLHPAPGDLYAEVNEMQGNAQAEPGDAILAKALAELEASRDPGQDPANITYPMFDLQNGAPLNPVAGRLKEVGEQETRRDVAVTPMPGRVSAPNKVRPAQMRGMSRAARNRKNTQAAQNAATNAAAQPPAAQNTGAKGSHRWPVAGEVSHNYGWEFNEKGNRTWNTGMTFAVSSGSPVTAPMEGTVAFAGKRDDTGMTVILDHEDGLRSIYGNAVTTIAVGERVAAGTQFASIAAGTGQESIGRAETLHFSIRRGELALNPEHVLAEGGRGTIKAPA